MKAGVVVKEIDEYAVKTAFEFIDWLEKKGVEVVLRRKKNFDKPPVPATAPDDLDFIFVFGGDGSFLSASRWVGKKNIPLIGAKFGEVGFLAEIEEKKLYDAASKVLLGEYSIEKRMRFEVSVERDGEIIFNALALNEAVIGKSGPAGLSRVDIKIDDYPLTTYSGDGLIISTPTGSTGYSLAAGGPVVHPLMEAMLLMPICPFTLTNRPLIIHDKSIITANLSKKSVSPLKLSVDGQKEAEIHENDKIILKKSDPVHLIILPDQSYFDVLKTKLKWSGERI